ncbi:hypothetical protein OUZ56_032082 [Daphnia magna]|uniref:Uncharacterized protein n=1 Tax=Daphnia magna TaxID=35525 RepID=A0ABQ9ZW54_9CRUS|nr:hypothetical protein OUZ56_032082 [Daphnia magna]
MTFSDNKYVFGRYPEIVGYWLQTIDSEILNCVLEQVQLCQQMEDEDFSTPIGKASAKSAVLRSNSTTLLQPLECNARKVKHERAIAAAQYNGWLAASYLKLPKCTKLQAFGQSAVVIKCNSELVKYSPCYWTNAFVNFTDKPYAFRNNTWKRTDTNMVLPEKTLVHSFRYEDVKFFDYEHRTNPAYNDNLFNHMNVMADIVVAMNEHPPTEFSLNHHPSASISVLVTAAGVVHYTSWWETIKMWSSSAYSVFSA